MHFFIGATSGVGKRLYARGRTVKYNSVLVSSSRLRNLPIKTGQTIQLLDASQLFLISGVEFLWSHIIFTHMIFVLLHLLKSLSVTPKNHMHTKSISYVLQLEKIRNDHFLFIRDF